MRLKLSKVERMQRCIPLIFLLLVGNYGQLDDVGSAMNEFTEISDPDYEMTRQIEIFEEGVLAKLRPEIQPRMRELFNEMRTLNEGEVRALFESRFDPEERAEIGNVIASAIGHELNDLIASVNAQSEGLNPGPLEVVKEGLKRLQDQLGKIFRIPLDNLGPQGLSDGWEDNTQGKTETNTTGNPPLSESFKSDPTGDAGDTPSPQGDQNPEEDKTEDEDEGSNEEEGEEGDGDGEDEDSDEDNEEDDGEEDGEYYDDEGDNESDEEDGGQGEDDGESFEEDEDGEEENDEDEDEEDTERNHRSRRSRDEDNARDEL